MDACFFNGDDKGRSRGVSLAVAAEKSGVVVWHEEADQRERDNVEERDAPEHLLDCGGKGLAGVGSLSSCKTDELGSGKRECRRYKYAAEAFEAVVKGTRVPPEFASYVTSVWRPAAIEYYAQ